MLPRPVLRRTSAAGAEGEPLTFDIDEVPSRVERLGDLFADTLTLKQHLPKRN